VEESEKQEDARHFQSAWHPSTRYSNFRFK